LKRRDILRTIAAAPFIGALVPFVGRLVPDVPDNMPVGVPGATPVIMQRLVGWQEVFADKSASEMVWSSQESTLLPGGISEDLGVSGTSAEGIFPRVGPDVLRRLADGSTHAVRVVARYVYADGGISDHGWISHFSPAVFK